MSVRGASKRIVDTLLSWEGVETHPHRFGGTEFRIGRREIGHIHGDSLVDIPFPKKIRDEIVAVGEASPHHILPETGWVSSYLKRDEDVDRAIQLLHRSYELALRQRNQKATESNNAIAPNA
jgi:predicted DNA-binding protein (MmcQ/YjbR family)